MIENGRAGMHELFVPMYRSNVEKTKRCLFGPPDPEETKMFIKEALERRLVENMANWNFDFHAGAPMEDGDFIWTPLTPPRVHGRPKKQRCQPSYDNSNCYFTAEEVEEAMPEQFFKPITPAKTLSFEQGPPARLRPAAPKTKQSLLTDFMTKKKRPAQALSKEDKSSERPAAASFPAKKARIGGPSS